MPSLVPPDELMIDPKYFERAADIMRRPDEFLPPDPNRKPLYKPRSGASIKTFKGLSSFTFAATSSLLVSALAQSVSTEVEKKKRQKRVKACIDECLEIVGRAKEVIEEGYASYRALETENEKRYSRRFYSRAGS